MHGSVHGCKAKSVMISVHGCEAKSVMISVHGCERLCDDVRMKE